MPQDVQNLVWIDMEMTGLDPQNDYVLEIATIITDKELNVLAEGPVIAVKQDDLVLDAMDEWNQHHHGKSGLIERVKQSHVTEKAAELLTLEFIQEWVPKRASPLCGNSICQDRRFMARWMPELEAYLHYRNLDVSTLKELASRWAPNVAEGYSKKGLHKALDDIIESIEELRYYRANIMKV